MYFDKKYGHFEVLAELNSLLLTDTLLKFYLVEDIDGDAIIFSVSNPESFWKAIDKFFDIFQFFVRFEYYEIPLTTFCLTCFSGLVETE